MIEILFGVLSDCFIVFICRITGFLDSWPKLEKWFTKFGTLQRVDASQPQRTVGLEVEKILEDTVNRVGHLCGTN